MQVRYSDALVLYRKASGVNNRKGDLDQNILKLSCLIQWVNKIALFQARQNIAVKHPIWREDKQIWRSVNGKEQIYFHSIILKETASSRKNSFTTKMGLQVPKKRQEDSYHISENSKVSFATF